MSKHYQNVDFSGHSFEGKNLKGYVFDNCNLQKANFSNACLDGVTFVQSDLTDSDFFNANLKDVLFDSSKINKVDFSYATLKKIEFYQMFLNINSILKSIDFSHAVLEDVQFKIAELDECKFNDAFLSKVNFSGQSLKNVKFCKAEIQKSCNFKRAILNHVDFSYCISFADFSGIVYNFASSEDYAIMIDSGTNLYNDTMMKSNDEVTKVIEKVTNKELEIPSFAANIIYDFAKKHLNLNQFLIGKFTKLHVNDLLSDGEKKTIKHQLDENFLKVAAELKTGNLKYLPIELQERIILRAIFDKKFPSSDVKIGGRVDLYFRENYKLNLSIRL